MYHSFNVEIAIEYDIPCAVLLSIIASYEQNSSDGIRSMGKTFKDLQALIPYYGAKKIRLALNTLMQDGLIESAIDGRTRRYTITEKGKRLLPEEAGW